ncbi:agarase, partial [bacterium]|nr:agarase [bacterium]
AFHKYDANHLLLGNRWQPGTANSEQLCRIAGRYVDVISVNYYAYAIDTEFLGRLHRWSGKKPMMLSEFYWASPSDTGLPGGKEVRSQRQRGLAYRQYVEQAAALGYVVGIEWFTLLDQARTGRFFERYNGEKGNTGLLSVTDRPYRELLDEAAKANHGIYDVLLGKREPFQYDDPLFKSKGQADQTVKIPRTAKPIQLDGQQSDWPGVPPDRISGKRLVEGANAGGVEAIFRLCWDDTQLYLLVDVTDPTPMKNEHKGDMLWSGDGVELFLGHEKLNQPGPLVFTDHQILLSAGKPDGQTQWYDAHAPRQYECRLVVAPRLDGAGYTLEAAIPFQALGFRPAEGTALRFDLGIDNSLDGSSRACQLMWNGGARNSGDRTHWGRAVLTK